MKQCRKSLANSSGVPVFAVLGDATLKELASQKPEKIAGLSRISGFGEVKIQHYGKAVIDVIAEYENDAEF